MRHLIAYVMYSAARASASAGEWLFQKGMKVEGRVPVETSRVMPEPLPQKPQGRKVYV